MIGDSALIQRMQESALAAWAEQLPGQLWRVEQERLHGDFQKWSQCLCKLPRIEAGRVILDADTIRADGDQPLTVETRDAIHSVLMQLHPWRKGPYRVHGIHIDTEWRSDWKWQRLQRAGISVAGKKVLDVGCGNGYHCWRMAGAGAELVIGIDPTQLFLAQFLAMKHFLGEGWPVFMLPLGIEDVPADLQAFDTVFSMGVLYHRRSPIDHLLELKACLRPGAELILETLVIEGDQDSVLVPDGRYAKMRNVWFIPSAAALAGWMRRCGFESVHILDITPTSTNEQRATEWMQFESLESFLDPQDPQHTIEGYPAPVRAILRGIRR